MEKSGIPDRGSMGDMLLVTGVEKNKTDTTGATGGNRNGGVAAVQGERGWSVG
jgi:hypothetical protein